MHGRSRNAEACAEVLEGFFQPRSVTVVGVAREEGKVGHYVFDNLREGGFEGAVYPVNPRADEIHGVRCYASVLDLPETPDLAVIVVPAQHTVGVMRECAEKGIDSVIVISAGFRETGREGGEIEHELVNVARDAGIRLLGPNCLGLIRTPDHLNASFAAGIPPAGGISFMSQSGALGTAVLDWAAGEGIGLATFVSLGNRADVSESDLLETWSEDPETQVMVAYLESVADGPRFIDVATAATRRKPVLAVKSGSSDAGARAVSSHTGSLAGSDAAYEAAFLRTGVIRARTAQELFDYATAFSLQPLPEGDGVAIITNAGGPAVMATDACEASGVPLASLENETVETLRESLPPAAAVFNPIDILGDASADRYRSALAAAYADPGVRCVLCIFTPQAMSDAVGTAQALVDAAATGGKTTLACFMGRDSLEEAWVVLRDGGIPQYVFPERAVATFAAMQRYRRHRAVPIGTEPPPDADRDAAASILEAHRGIRGGFVTDRPAAEVVAAYGIRVPRGAVGRDLSEVRSIAADIGYPVVAKIASPDILHKSDIGGIRVNLRDEAELSHAYEEILARAWSYAPDASIAGLYVQQMIPPGKEIIIGVDRDPTFGPMLMFGLGGVYVETLKDVAFRLCPLDRASARQLVTEIRSFGLLRGARGETPSDVDAIVDAIVRISHLAMDRPDIVELDINPLIVGPIGAGAIAADVRIGIGGAS